MKWFVMLVVATSIARAAPAPYQDDPRHPYALKHGMYGPKDRADGLVALAERVGDEVRAARYLVIACHYRSIDLSDATLSSPECKRARELGEKHGLVDIDVYLLFSRGNRLAWKLDIPGSVASLQQAIERGKSLDVNAPIGLPIRHAQLTLAAMMVEGGKYDLANTLLDGLKRSSAAAGDREMEGWTEMWICRAHARIAEYAKAREACVRARAISEQEQDWYLLLNLEWIESDFAAKVNRVDDTRRHLEAAWKLAEFGSFMEIRPTLALELVFAYVDTERYDDAAIWEAKLVAMEAPPMFTPQIAYVRAGLARVRGDITAAVAGYEVAKGSAVHTTAIRARYQLADAKRALGDFAGSRAALEDAIARVETDRSAVGPDQRASFMSLHALAYRALVGVLFDEQGAASAARALEVAEAGRARSLLDAIAMTGSETAARPVRTTSEILASLADGVVLIEYVVALDRTFAITATHTGVTIVPLPNAGGDSELATRVSFFRQLVTEASRDAEIAVPARRLFRDLLAPALPENATTLVISPDGPLHALPWDALAIDDDFVIDRFNVAVVPSASVIASRAPTNPSATALVVAMPDAVDKLAALSRATDEAAVVRKRLGGEVRSLVGGVADEAAITDGIERFAVLHFASHAQVDLAMPLRSALVVANGRLRADAIYRMRVAADLVVLAACETGIGAATSGEGVMSLSRAFLHAGAGATISTLWPVADAIGPSFADSLYRRLAGKSSIVQAATAAKRELRASGARPVDWAAYVVAASPSATARVTAGDVSTPLRIPWAAIIVALGALVVLVFQRRAVFAAATALTVALVVVTMPERPQLSVARGDVDRVAATFAGDRVSWTAEPGVSYRATFYDEAGQALGTLTAPGAPPRGAHWVMIEAERDGQPAKRPALLATAP